MDPHASGGGRSDESDDTTVVPRRSIDPSRLALIAAVGLGAGFLSGLFGVGGGILIVPALVMVVKMDQRLAHGTSLAAVLPISLASLVGFWTQGHIDWPVALFLAVGAVCGAVLGTTLLHVLPHRVLGLVFAIVLLISAIRLFLAVDADGRGSLTVISALSMVGVGVVTGVLAGLLGVGGGIVMVPAMIVAYGMTPVLAKGTSIAVIIPTSIMGTWRNRKNRNADLTVAAAMGVTGIPAAWLGTQVSGAMSDTTSNVLFATLMTIVAIRMLLQLFRERRSGRVPAD